MIAMTVEAVLKSSKIRCSGCHECAQGRLVKCWIHNLRIRKVMPRLLTWRLGRGNESKR